MKVLIWLQAVQGGTAWRSCCSRSILLTHRASLFALYRLCLMKMWLWSRISTWVFLMSARRSPTVRVLLKRGESPVVSVSITRWFMGISFADVVGF